MLKLLAWLCKYASDLYSVLMKKIVHFCEKKCECTKMEIPVKNVEIKFLLFASANKYSVIV